MQIDVEGFISDPHRTATQFDRFPVSARDQLVVLKSLQHLFRCCRLDRILGSRRLAGLNPVSESLPKHTDRTEFHCSRKLVAAARADALELRTHRPCPPFNCNPSEKQHHSSPSGVKSAGTALGILLSRCTRSRVFHYTSASNHVSEQNSYPWCPASVP